MHSLSARTSPTVPALYVKSAYSTYAIRSIFLQARIMAPCMLIFEDIDTIVTPNTRSYFFNEVDGLENNNGIFMVASTNHLDQLDPGLSSRPSRFDRKYLFPLPSDKERVLYCEYWRNKLKSKPSIKFPRKLCPAIAAITAEFSFAYLQEAFVATLLAIAGRRSENSIRGGGDDEGGDLDDYELWREMKKQVKALRDDMDNTKNIVTAIELPEPDVPYEGAAAQQSKPSNPDAKGIQTFALASRFKGPMVQHNHFKAQQMSPTVAMDAPVIFDRDGHALTPLTGPNGLGPKSMPLFSSDDKLLDRAFVNGSSLL